MIARSQLAVLDFNAGVCIIQAETRDGIKRYKLQFSKITQSWVVKKVKDAKEKTYIDHLMSKVFKIVVSNDSYEVPQLNVLENIAQCEKPLKDDCIKNMKTRFSI